MDPVPSTIRNLIACVLLQSYGRTPTSREVDIAELQEAWNKANPLLVPLAIDGMGSARTEEALRGWLERLRVEEFARLNMANPWITYIPIGTQQHVRLQGQITTPIQYIIENPSYPAGSLCTIQSKP